MHTAFLLAVGSRGDHEPLIALSAVLLRSEAFQAVHLFISPEYWQLPVPHPKLHIHNHALLSLRAFESVVAPFLNPSALAEDPVAAQRRAIGAVVEQLVTPLTPDLHTLCQDLHPTILLATSLGALSLKSLSIALKVPAYLLHMQPNIPNPCFPFYLSSLPNAIQAAIEIATHPMAPITSPRDIDYSETHNSFLDIFLSSLPQYQAMHNQLALPEISAHSVQEMFAGQDPHISVLLSYPTQLIPFPLPPSPSLNLVEPLAEAYLPPDWNPSSRCQKLSKYLTVSNPKPFCVTVSSIDADPAFLPHISTALLSGLRRASIPRVLLLHGSGTGHISSSHVTDTSLLSWAADHVFECTEPVQFAWLFPHCAAVLCHGGAGTVAAALRAGIPVVVAPVMVDQFFWGELVERWQVGVRIKEGLMACSTDNVHEAVQKAVGQELVSSARMYAERQRERVGGCEAVMELMCRSEGTKDVK